MSQERNEKCACSIGVFAVTMVACAAAFFTGKQSVVQVDPSNPVVMSSEVSEVSEVSTGNKHKDFDGSTFDAGSGTTLRANEVGAKVGKLDITPAVVMKNVEEASNEASESTTAISDNSGPADNKFPVESEPTDKPANEPTGEQQVSTTGPVRKAVAAAGRWVVRRSGFRGRRSSYEYVYDNPGYTTGYTNYGYTNGGSCTNGSCRRN